MWFGTCDSFDMLGFQEGFEYMVRSFVEPNRPRGVDADEQYYAKTVLDQIQVSVLCKKILCKKRTSIIRIL